MIDLSDNELRKLGNFPTMRRLKALLLHNNQIARIDPELGNQLPTLETLMLTNNSIAHFADIDALAELPSLHIPARTHASHPIAALLLSNESERGLLNSLRVPPLLLPHGCCASWTTPSSASSTTGCTPSTRSLPCVCSTSEKSSARSARRPRRERGLGPDRFARHAAQERETAKKLFATEEGQSFVKEVEGSRAGAAALQDATTGKRATPEQIEAIKVRRSHGDAALARGAPTLSAPCAGRDRQRHFCPRDRAP